MKHVWRVSRRFGLAAAGPALIAGTAVILAAAGVRDPWALAGATAAAAVIAVSAGIGYHRHRGQQQREHIIRGQDGCLMRAGGSLPAVRDVTDPVRLGTHAAAAVEPAPGAVTGGAEGSPAYVPRDLDGELREQLAAGGFVLLVGDSAAGKTRMAVEAMHATFPGHTLIAPVRADGIAAAMRHAAGEPRCVLWLDDLERFLGPGGMNAADVRRLLGGGGHHRVIAATIRAAELARLIADSRDDDTTRRMLRDIREVMDQARQIRIARLFSPSELDRAGTRSWDPRIAEAIRHADSYGIAEYLAGGPSLLRDWEEARSSATGPHARGAAIVTAAVDIRRAGYNSPIPRRLLDEVHEHYLDDPGHAGTPREPLAEAWAWATAQRSAAAGLLNPVGDDRVEVFDYLVDMVQRRAGALEHVLEPVVRRALAFAGAADATSIAATAYNQGRWPLAGAAWRLGYQLLASDPGAGQEHPDTLTCRGNLADVLRDLGQLDEAEAGIRAVLAARQRVLGPDHDETLASRGSLADVLHARGELTKAEAEIRAVLSARRRVLGRNHPDTLATRTNLAGVLHARGRLDKAEAEVRAVLAIRLRLLGAGHPDTLASRNNLAGVLRDLGRLDEAEAEIRAALAARQLVLGADHPDSLASRSSLARVLRDLGWLDEAEAETRAVLAIRMRVLGPDHPSTLATRNNLAGVLHVRGRLDEAEAEIRAVLATTLRTLGPEHPDTLASRGNLGLVLRDLGRLDEAKAEQDAVLDSRQPVPGTGRRSAVDDASPNAASDAGSNPDAEMIRA